MSVNEFGDVIALWVKFDDPRMGQRKLGTFGDESIREDGCIRFEKEVGEYDGTQGKKVTRMQFPFVPGLPEAEWSQQLR